MATAPKFRQLHPGMGQAVAERTYLRRKENGEWETWGDVAHRVALGNSLLVSEKSEQKSEYKMLRKHIANATLLLSGRHLQHGDETQPTRNMEIFTNCSTSASSFMMFYLLLNGSGVGRCYDDDMMLVNWDYAPNVRCVIDQNHADFDWSAHESLRDAKHKYGKGKDVLWFEVPDSREGWAKAVEIWENAAFQKIHKDKLFILDFSKVRPKGAAIGGMQNRPSSGPVPLMNAFHKSATLKGSNLDRWHQALYVDHYFAECVLVGGARRSARMSTKSWRNESVLDFITVKRPVEYNGLKMEEIKELREKHTPDGFLWSSNNSVAADEEFWKLVNLKRNDRGFNSTLAQHARRVIRALAQASYGDGTGEPGIINVDKLVQKEEGWETLTSGDYIGSSRYQPEEETELYMSRLARKAKKMKYHMITNPSMRAGTKVVTRTGVVPIESLEDTDFEVKTRDGKWATAQCWLSGQEKSLYKIMLAGGHEHYATAEHKWPVMTNNGTVRTVTTELEPGDYLPVIQTTSLFEGGEGTRDDGFMIGWNLGDGWISKRTCDGKMQLGFIVSDDDERNGIKDVLIPIIESHGYTGNFHNKTEINTSCKGMRDIFEKYGVVHKSYGLPDFVFDTASNEFRAGVIDGLFSSDGSVSRGSDLVFTSVYRQLIDDVAALLSLYGIPSMIYPSISVLNGKSFQRYDLKVTKRKALQHFNMIFELTHRAKAEKLFNAASRKTVRDSHIDRIKIIAVEKTELREDVWDINVHDDTHSFQIPHCITGNCGEIALTVLGGYCTIADVVPYHAETLDEAEEAFRAAVRALIRVNTMDCLYATEVRRTNRIGIGMTGVMEFAWKFFRYGFKDLIDEEKSKDFWLTLARFNQAVYDEAVSYSNKLGVTIPHTMTTIKPAGTTSKLFGLCEGWHLPSMKWYMRWVQFRNDDPLVDTYRAAGYPVRELKQYRGHTIVGFPTQPVIASIMDESKLVTAAEATPEEQYNWLLLGEKYYINGTDEEGNPVTDRNIGNQISYTLKYKPSEVDYKHFKDMLIQYQSQIRACSVMPQEDVSAYEYQPEEQVTKAKYEEMSHAIKAALEEDIGKEHVDCEGGACPIDFRDNADVAAA